LSRKRKAGGGRLLATAVAPKFNISTINGTPAVGRREVTVIGVKPCHGRAIE